MLNHSTISQCFRCLWIGAVVGSTGWFNTGAAIPGKASDEEVRKISSAVPDRAPAKPRKPRRLLVFTLTNGYYHQSIPQGAKAVELMGTKTGAFESIVSDDPNLFEPGTLDTFDAICLVSALGEFFHPTNFEALAAPDQEVIRQKDTRLKTHLAEYIRGGKGLVGIHGASYAFCQWPEFGVILGGVFDSHPWSSTERLAVKIDDPHSPLNAAFGSCGFDIIDEGYQFKAPYSRSQVRVLLSLDVAQMNMQKNNLRADRDFGLSWVKTYGAGRVFYSALGHNPEEFWNPHLLRHFLSGIQFALGDLEAETTPVPAQ